MHLDLGLLFQAVGNGIALGWLYILIALGLALIFSIMDILQFAHGEIYMIAAYISYFLCTNLGMNIYMAMIISMAAMAIVGVIMERFLFRPVRGIPKSNNRELGVHICVYGRRHRVVWFVQS